MKFVLMGLLAVSLSVRASASDADLYVREISKRIYRNVVTCPEKLWTDFHQTKKISIILLHQAEMRAHVLDLGKGEEPVEMAYDTLPIGVRDSTGGIGRFEANGEMNYYFDLSFMKPYEKPNSPNFFERSPNFSTFIHEFFHFSYQHQVWENASPGLARLQIREFPLYWHRQYFAYRLLTELKRYFSTGQGLEAAAFWHLQYLVHFPEEYKKVLRYIDRKEGTAAHIELIADLVAFDPAGCQIAEADIFQQVQRHFDAVFDPELMLIPFAMDSYKAGSLASLILRRDRGRAWETEIETRDASPIELLLSNVTPAPQSDDFALISKIQKTVQEINQDHEKQVTSFVNLAKDPETLFLKIPNRVSDVAGWFGSDLSVNPTSMPEINIILSAVLFSHSFSETEFIRYQTADIGLNFTQDPCYQGPKNSGNFDELGTVLLLPKTALSSSALSFDDGNVQIQLTSNRFTTQLSQRGQIWICLK